MLLRLLAALALVASSSVMAIFGVAGASRLSGPVIFSITDHHGVHLDDLLIVACWLLTFFVATVLVFWRR